MPKLRAARAEKGLDTKGLKVALVERLVGALRAEATGEAPAAAEPAAPAASDAMEAEPAARPRREASDAMEAEPAFDEASATKAAKKLSRRAPGRPGGRGRGHEAASRPRSPSARRRPARGRRGAPPAAPEASDATEAATEAEEGFDEAAATRQAKKMKVAELRARRPRPQARTRAGPESGACGAAPGRPARGGERQAGRGALRRGRAVAAVNPRGGDKRAPSLPSPCVPSIAIVRVPQARGPLARPVVTEPRDLEGLVRRRRGEV